MKSRKLFTGITALAMGVTMLSSTAPLFAAEGSKDVPVTYTSGVVADPDNPTNAKWGVSVPTSISFTDTAKTITAVDVELVGLNGYVINDLTDTFNVEISAQSLNGMTLNMGSMSVAYTLTYGGNSVTTTTKGKIADLTKAAPKQTGTAVLTGTATAKGTYTDTMTYFINKTAD